MQAVPSLLNAKFDRWFVLFVLFHLILWTLAPTMVRQHLPMDSIEGALWGQQLEWGYDKNPFVSAWITIFFARLGQYHDGFIYFASQLAIITCFIATWKLAKQMVSLPFAFLSVLLLEGIQYYHLHSIDLSDNLLELATWSLTVYAFYRAVRGSKVAWVFTGVFAAIAMLTKYYSGFLLFSLAIFLVSDKTARKQLTTFPPYLGLFVFTLLLMPHVVWLVTHDFITIRYMLTRTDSVIALKNHFLFPLQFIYEQFLIALPMFILYVALFFGHTQEISESHESKTDTFNQRFLFCAAILPFLFTVLVSLLFALKLHAGWGSPLMTLWPLTLFVWFKRPLLSMKKMYVMTSVVSILMCALAVAYAMSLMYSNTPTSANFPGKKLAKIITAEWHERYHTPLLYVAGARFLAGSVSYYSPDHPSVWIEWSNQSSPWIQEAMIKKYGAVFIFYPHQAIPDHVKVQFSKLPSPITMQLDWLRNDNKLPAEDIRVIYVPPDNTSR